MIAKNQDLKTNSLVEMYTKIVDKYQQYYYTDVMADCKSLLNIIQDIDTSNYNNLGWIALKNLQYDCQLLLDRCYWDNYDRIKRTLV